MPCDVRAALSRRSRELQVRQSTVNTSRKATGGLPNHQARFDPHIYVMNLQNLFKCHEIL